MSFTRFALLLVASLLALTPARAQDDFRNFVDGLWPKVEQRGISRRLFESTFAGMTPDASVIELTKRQPEYGKPFAAYLAGALSAMRIAGGRSRMAQHGELLRRIAERYDVPGEIVVAIWGLETNFGGFSGDKHVVRSLATLCYSGYRRPYFEGELITALQLIAAGEVTEAKMRGSWAGAMGQSQFMPSSFVSYAVDFDGDGRKDIWGSIPDSLASIANYLRGHGWRAQLPWGYEVVLPDGFDRRISRGDGTRWTELGVRRIDGGALPPRAALILFFPAGTEGPALLVSQNFDVIKTYNNSDAYALAVALLADAIAGRARLRTAWPSDDRPLPRETRVELQKRIAALGFPVRDFDGRIDFDLRDSIRELQTRFGMTPDGAPTFRFMDVLRAAAPDR